MSYESSPLQQLDAFRLHSPLNISTFPGRPLSVALYDEFVYIGFDVGLLYAYHIEQPKRMNNDRRGREEEREWTLVAKKVIGKGKKIVSMEVCDPLNDPPSAPTPHQITYNNNNNSKGGKGRENIGVAAPIEQPLLFVLCDGKITAHHPHTLDILINFQPLSDIDMFTIDLKPPHHLAIHTTKKRKQLSLVSYQLSANLQHSATNIVKELPLPLSAAPSPSSSSSSSSADLPLSFIWQGEWLCLSFRRSYILLNSYYGDVREVPVPVEGIYPCVYPLNASEMLLSASSALGIFLNYRGEPSQRNPIDWRSDIRYEAEPSDSPFKMDGVDHYILGLFTEDNLLATSPTNNSSPPGHMRHASSSASFSSIRIASLLDQKIKQTFPIPLPLTSAASKDKLVVLTNSGDIFSLSLVSIEEQISQYMDLSLTDEALSLLLRTKPSQSAIAEFHTSAGFTMLKDLQFTAALSHFLLSSVDVRELFVLFEDLTLDGLDKGSMIYKKKLGDIKDIIEKGRKTAGMKSEDKRYKAVLSLSVKQLMKQAKLLIATLTWDRKTKGLANKNDNLLTYIDTVLLILGVELLNDPTTVPATETNTSSTTAVTPSNQFPYTIKSLLFPSNHVLLSFAEPFLLNKNAYNTLALLYQSVKQNKAALEVWVRMGSGEWIDTHANSIKEEEAGIKETVALLSTLPDTPLLWEFSEWVLLRDPSTGLDIFTNPGRKDNNLLPYEKVLQYLRRVASKSTDPTIDNSKNIDLVESYLEYIVLGQKINDSIYHTQLAITYVRKTHQLLSTTTTKVKKSKKGAAVVATTAAPPPSNSALTRGRPGSEGGVVGVVRGKLYHFLQHSPYYDADQTVQILILCLWSKEKRIELASEEEDRAGGNGTAEIDEENDPFYLPSSTFLFQREILMIEELIYLFTKIELYKKVLKLYIFALKDQIGAGHYCLTVSKQKKRLHHIEIANTILRESKAKEEKIKSAEENIDSFNRSGRLSNNNSNNIARDEEEDEEDDEFSNDRAAILRRRRKQHEREEQERRQREVQDELARQDQEALQTAEMNAEIQGHYGDIFLLLIDLYFTEPFFRLFASEEDLKHDDPSSPPPSAYEAAVDALTLYYRYIDPVKALKAIPPWVPLSSLFSLFSRVLPLLLHNRRHQQVIKQLNRTFHLSIQSTSIYLRSAVLSIDTTTKCCSCGKAIGDSFFVAVPVRQGQMNWRDAVIPKRGIITEEEEEDNNSNTSNNAGGSSHTVTTAGDKTGMKMSEGLGYVIVHYQCANNYMQANKKNIKQLQSNYSQNTERLPHSKSFVKN